MNRIVKEHYPVEKLPAELKAGLPADRMVKVTLEVEEPGLRSAQLADLKGRRRGSFGSIEAVNAYVRSQRAPDVS